MTDTQYGGSSNNGSKKGSTMAEGGIGSVEGRRTHREALRRAGGNSLQSPLDRPDGLLYDIIVFVFTL
jgi:hypothetical protein